MILHMLMKAIINVAMVFSVTLMSEKECNDFKVTKTRKEILLERKNDYLQHSCIHQILAAFDEFWTPGLRDGVHGNHPC